MPETLVEKEICEACGTGVRNGSTFCYNCGEAVIEEPPPPAIVRPDPALLNGGKAGETDTLDIRDPEPPPVAIPRGGLEPPPDTAPKTEKFPAATVPVRKPLRKRSKKAAEVEWVERPSSSAAFIVTAIVLAVIAALLVAAGLYLR